MKHTIVWHDRLYTVQAGGCTPSTRNPHTMPGIPYIVCCVCVIDPNHDSVFKIVYVYNGPI
jgi:hypothetical protein